MNYKEILKGIVNIINTTEKSDIGFANICSYIGENCPELKESEDEKIINEIISYLNSRVATSEETELLYFKRWIAWLEKQGTPAKLGEKEIQTAKDEMFPYQDNVGRSYEQAWAASGFELGAHWVLNKLKSNGYSDETYKQGEFGTFDAPQTPFNEVLEVTSRMQYISDDMKPIAEFIMDYANWDLRKEEWSQPTLTVPLFRVLDALIQRGKPYGECSQNIEKQCEQKPAVVDFNAKDWYVSKVDGKIHDMTYNPADKVEPKFKVKYAGSEYNVLEVKDIAGVTFYGIEDEPNHIDYVKADNCEIISGYGIKENGSPYPTKPSMFSEQKPAEWSEEDEEMTEDLIKGCISAEKAHHFVHTSKEIADWLKSLKDRIGG